MTANHHHASSFKDPSGYIFIDDGDVKRQINPIYFDQYNALKTSGFFDKLFKAELLIPHKEISVTQSEIIILPEQIPFIVYPYEWSFNQYKEAALLTLKIQKYSLEHGFSLKDASAFNITFYKGKSIFIDTLSFDFYKENSPWRAYKQFISHFLGPLVLARYHGARALKLMSNFIDGIPIKLVASMLPIRAKFSPFLYSNIHLLAKYEDKHNNDLNKTPNKISLSKKAQMNIVESLYGYIKNLELKEESEWGDYYSKTNYTNDAFNFKTELINKWIVSVKPQTLVDIGGNDGTFVRRINYNFDHALVCDIDNNAVDCHYKTLKENDEQNITPFVLDILNPSAAIGFHNKERQSILERINSFRPDVTLALALIHHMSLSGNVTFKMSAEFFASFSKHLIIEFPKPNDSWVERLLNTKGEFRNHFDFYNQENFEIEYNKFFNIIEKVEIRNSDRIMYLMKKKNAV